MSTLAQAGDGGGGSDAGTATRTRIAAQMGKTVLLTDQQNKDLINPWGLAFNETAGPAWIGNNGTGTATVLDARNNLLLTVKVPAPQGVDQAAPTGVVFNKNNSAFSGDTFIFVTEDGTVAGWQQASGATLRVSSSAGQKIYKGATIATSAAGQSRLYATDFRNGKVDVYDQSYAPVQLTDAAFKDPNLPSGYAPFNVEALGNLVMVTYAKQDENAKDDVKGVGNGFLDVFDTEGTFISRLAANGALNSPWAMAVTPDDFGAIPHRLLVGNFGDGLINVFSVELAQTGLRARFEGQIGDTSGSPIVIDGLWSLRFGRGNAFNPAQLFFTAGPGDEKQGQFGRLDLVVQTAPGDAGTPDTGAGDAGEGGTTDGGGAADAGGGDAGGGDGGGATDAGTADADAGGADGGADGGASGL